MMKYSGEESMRARSRLFLDTTSLHSASRISTYLYTVKSDYRLILWIITLLTSVGILIWWSSLSINAYTSYGTNVISDIIRTNKLRFPAVTVCNNNPVRKSAVEDLVPHLIPLLCTDYDQDYRIHMRDENCRAKMTRLEKRSRYLEEMAKLPLSTRYAIGDSQESLIVLCTFEDRPCDELGFAFTIINDPLQGNCYTFNLRKENQTDAEIVNELVVRDSGKDGALMIEFFVQKVDYFPVLAGTPGVKIIVHSPDVLPMPGESEGILAEAGGITSIGLRRTDILRLPPPYQTMCINMTNSPLTVEASDMYADINRGLSYSSRGCLKTCEFVPYKDCACSLPYPIPVIISNRNSLPSHVDSNICTTEQQLECVHSMRADAAKIKEIEDCQATCMLPCQEVDFLPIISVGKWPPASYSMQMMETGSHPHIKHLALPDLYKYLDSSEHELVHTLADCGILIQNATEHEYKNLSESLVHMFAIFEQFAILDGNPSMEKSSVVAARASELYKDLLRVAPKSFLEMASDICLKRVRVYTIDGGNNEGDTLDSSDQSDRQNDASNISAAAADDIWTDYNWLSCLSTNGLVGNLLNAIERAPIQLTNQYVAGSLGKLLVFYDSLSNSRLTHEPAMSVIDLLGNLGGFCGLFIGFSLITAVEILEYIIDIALITIYRKY